MTNTVPGIDHRLSTAVGVYAPQQDSQLLVDTLERTVFLAGRRVMDLCTGTGIGAIAAAELGAASVTAWDICQRALRCAQANAARSGIDADVRKGSLAHALHHGPYDVVVSNPPYVPTPHGVDYVALPAHVGPAREFAGVDRSLKVLRAGGLAADVAAWQSIPFGPVLSARAAWLERTGRLERGRRDERLVAILAHKSCPGRFCLCQIQPLGCSVIWKQEARCAAAHPRRRLNGLGVSSMNE